MTDDLAEAEAMFRAIADRHGLTIETQDQANTALSMIISGTGSQSNGEVCLAFQNGDEVSFRVYDFWSTFFPFETVKGLFEKAVEGWFTRQTRLAYYWRGKRLVKICLQVKLKNGKWQRIYTEYKTWFLPFLTTRTDYKTGARDESSISGSTRMAR